jgi:cell division protein FtsB
MATMKRRIIALLLATLALTAGCTGAGDSGGADAATEVALAEDQAYEGEAAVEEATVMATGTPMAEPADKDGGDGGTRVDDYDAQQFANRQLILTGHVAVEVEDFEASRRNLTRATESYGGFVSDTRQEVHRRDNDTWTEGVVVLRVPRDNFTAVYERARAEGELLEASRESQDVTDQLVDLNARLENLRAERDQLRELYRRANETEDVLRVQERLSEVQGEIERLEARRKSLRERVALSTITVRLREPRPEPDRPGPDAWYDVPLLSAFLESVNGVIVTIRAVGVAIAYAVPYVIAFGVPLAALGYGLRRRRGRGRIRGWFAKRFGSNGPETVEEIDGGESDTDEE